MRARELACRGVLGGENTGNGLGTSWSILPPILWECWDYRCLLQPLLCVGSRDPNPGQHTWLASATELSPQPRPCLTKTTKKRSHGISPVIKMPAITLRGKIFVGLAVHIFRPDPCKFDVCHSVLKANSPVVSLIQGLIVCVSNICIQPCSKKWLHIKFWKLTSHML